MTDSTRLPSPRPAWEESVLGPLDGVRTPRMTATTPMCGGRPDLPATNSRGTADLCPRQRNGRWQRSQQLAASARAYAPRHSDPPVTARGRRTVERLLQEGRL